MAKKVLGGAVGALGLAVAAARHAAWYVSYQVNGRTREDEPPDDRRD